MSGLGFKICFQPNPTITLKFINRIADSESEHVLINQQNFKRLEKTCKFAFTNYILLQIINQNLITAARKQHEKTIRIREHFNHVKIMSLVVIKEREQHA